MVSPSHRCLAANLNANANLELRAWIYEIYGQSCPKPVISAIHSACIGGGVDLVCATDIRLASSDAWFSVKEARKDGGGA